MPVSAPADKRFRRPHVRPARRRSWRGWRKRVVVAAAALVLVVSACYGAGTLALSSEALTVRSIRVEGNDRISAGEVDALLEGAVGSSLLTADIDGWREKLRAAPWVEDAVIRRVFPGSVSVTLTERRAMAIARVDGTLYLVDQSATMIEEYGPSNAELDLPVIDGLATRRAGALLVNQDRAALTGRLLAALQSRRDLDRRISQIDVSDLHDVVVVLENDTALVHIGSDHFVERLQSYVDLAEGLRERVLDIEYVDLRYGERVFVGSRRANASARGASRRSKG